MLILCAYEHNMLFMVMDKNKHSDCNYFKNGFCTFHNKPVNPDGAICPMYSPRNSVTNIKKVQGTLLHEPLNNINYFTNYRNRGKRRRNRHSRKYKMNPYTSD